MVVIGASIYTNVQGAQFGGHNELVGNSKDCVMVYTIGFKVQQDKRDSRSRRNIGLQ